MPSGKRGCFRAETNSRSCSRKVPKCSSKRYSALTVGIPMRRDSRATVEETGQLVTYQESADVAIQDVLERKELTKRLIECLNS